MGNVEIYTDGGCVPNPGPGAWACVILMGDDMTELSGRDDDTTNNRMELMAVIAALESLSDPSKVLIHTDSQLTMNCGMGQWKRKLNKDLWARFDAVGSQHELKWEWVRGHNGDRWNERCHELVTALLPWT